MADSIAIPRQNPDIDLTQMTDARVALGRFGAGMPTRASQAFLLDHARARQAVWSTVDTDRLAKGLGGRGCETVIVDSQAQDRSTYIRRPDLGRLLSHGSAERLTVLGTGYDVAVVIADGLSSTAVELNAIPLAAGLMSRFASLHMALSPIIVARQARVALSDPVGEALRARIVVMLIGERPGLSASDSIGVYITHQPKAGTPDSSRNCISNVREGGLAIPQALDSIVALVTAIRQTGISGVGLKDAVAALR